MDVTILRVGILLNSRKNAKICALNSNPRSKLVLQRQRSSRGNFGIAMSLQNSFSTCTIGQMGIKFYSSRCSIFCPLSSYSSKHVQSVYAQHIIGPGRQRCIPRSRIAKLQFTPSTASIYSNTKRKSYRGQRVKG